MELYTYIYIYTFICIYIYIYTHTCIYAYDTYVDSYMRMDMDFHLWKLLVRSCAGCRRFVFGRRDIRNISLHVLVSFKVFQATTHAFSWEAWCSWRFVTRISCFSGFWGRCRHLVLIRNDAPGNLWHLPASLRPSGLLQALLLRMKLCSWDSVIWVKAYLMILILLWVIPQTVFSCRSSSCVVSKAPCRLHRSVLVLCWLISVSRLRTFRFS
jgi:hypothetical protein